MKIDEIIVVEGRDDTEAVKRACECETIETHGFGMAEEMWKSLDTAYRNKGLIILTDPDHAGSEIRRKIKERFPDSKEAFLPRGKAKRGRDIGVENAKPEDIRETLSKVKRKASESTISIITEEMFEEAGLNGSAGSRGRREQVADRLGLAYGNAKTLREHMNAFGITAGEFNEAIRAIDDPTDKE